MIIPSLNTFYLFLWSIVIIYPLVFLFFHKQVKQYSRLMPNFISINVFLIQIFSFCIFIFSVFLCMKLNINFIDLQEELVRYALFSLIGFLFFYFFGKTNFIGQWLLANTLMRVSLFITFLYVLLGVVFWNLSAEEFNSCLVSIMELYYNKIVDIDLQNISEDLVGYYFLYYFFYIFKVFFTLFIDKTLAESLSYLTLSSILFDILCFYLPSIETPYTDTEISTMMFKITQKNSTKFSVAFRKDFVPFSRRIAITTSICNSLEVLNSESFKVTVKFFKTAPVTETTVAQKLFTCLVLDDFNRNTNDMRESINRIFHVVSAQHKPENLFKVLDKFCPKLAADMYFKEGKPIIKHIKDPLNYFNSTDLSVFKDATSLFGEVYKYGGKIDFRKISTMQTVLLDASLNKKKLYLPDFLKPSYNQSQSSYLLASMIGMHLDKDNLPSEVLFYDKAQGLYNNCQLLIKSRETAAIVPIQNQLKELTGKNLSVLVPAGIHLGDVGFTTSEVKDFYDSLAEDVVAKSKLLDAKLTYAVDTVDRSFALVNLVFDDRVVDKDGELVSHCYNSIKLKMKGNNYASVNININIPNCNLSPDVILEKIRQFAADSDNSQMGAKISNKQIIITTANS